jgi:hypothetical protein
VVVILCLWSEFCHKLNQALYNKPLTGLLVTSSVDHELIKVEDLGMGTTAIATQNTGWDMRV